MKDLPPLLSVHLLTQELLKTWLKIRVLVFVDAVALLTFLRTFSCDSQGFEQWRPLFTELFVELGNKCFVLLGCLMKEMIGYHGNIFSKYTTNVGAQDSHLTRSMLPTHGLWAAKSDRLSYSLIWFSSSQCVDRRRAVVGTGTHRTPSGLCPD